MKPQDYVSRGIRAHQAGDLRTAAQNYEAALAISPTDADVLNLLAIVMLQVRQPGKAIDLLRRAVAARPRHGEVQFNLGDLLAQSGDLDAAMTHLQTAAELLPDKPEVHLALGIVCCRVGRHLDGIRAFRRVLALRPGMADAENNLGNALLETGEASEAVAAYRRALSLAPGHPPAMAGLPRALAAAEQFAEAEAAFDALLARFPQDGGAWNGRGLLMRRMGRPQEAAAAFERAATLHRAHEGEIRTTLGIVLAGMGEIPRAVDQWRRALAVTPGYPPAVSNLYLYSRVACRWSESNELEPQLRRSIGVGAAPPPLPVLLFSPSLEEQKRAAEAYARLEFGRIPRDQFPLRREPRRRLTIGYLSADFREHAVAYLVAEVLELHDRERCKVIAFSVGTDDGSAIRNRIANGVDQFVDLSKTSDGAAARAIHGAEVDVLVDLNGYTTGTRIAVAAGRPAPVQVNWLGYPGTTGADFIDYVIADGTVIPAAQDANWSEAVVRLPGVYQPNDRQRPRPLVAPSRADLGLPNDKVICAAFNQTMKLSSTMFAAWMRLLMQEPDAILWLQVDAPEARDTLKSAAASAGVASDRLHFAPRVPLKDHLARYLVADLFIDTFPYSAHTTASDALWMGCPVVTLAGDTFASRVAASLLHAVGLDDLVTRDLESYERLIGALIRDPGRRAGYRRHLDDIRLSTSLFDAPTITRALETAYRRMYDAWLEGRPPTSFSVA